MNRSRVGRLAGLIGSMSRPIVQRRARSGLMKSLTQTKQRFEAARYGRYKLRLAFQQNVPAESHTLEG